MNDKICFYKRLFGIDGVHSEPIELGESFEEFTRRFAGLYGTVVLLSGGDVDCARYNVIGINPWLTFRAKGIHNAVLVDGEEYIQKGDPFETLRLILNACHMSYSAHNVPIVAGLLGYFSYDLKDRIEVLSRTTLNDVDIPDLCFYAPSCIVVHDCEEQKTTCHIVLRNGNHEEVIQKQLACLRAAQTTVLCDIDACCCDTEDVSLDSSIVSNFSKSAYVLAVEKIKSYIAKGDVFQVNLSQRFLSSFGGNPYSFFCDLFKRNPAPFFAYINAGDHHIISSSPERFLQRDGQYIETRPIKGTRPRGNSPQEDESMAMELEASSKDDAEHLMIVDLLRNDLAKVCVPGSVEIKEFKRIERYANVFHAVSVITGQKDEGVDSVDLVRAVYPGGSITGCPKIRAMEIIDELEPTSRNVYTGAIGYLSFHDTLDFSVAIRTAVVKGCQIYFSVGGGIVFDSDPIDEYKETLSKGASIFASLGLEEQKSKGVSTMLAWMNGKIEPDTTPLVSPADWGLQYGCGLFETIRVCDGTPQHLDAHLKRFAAGCEALFKTEIPELSWDEIIRQVLQSNNLTEGVVAIKIMAALRENGECPNSPFHLVVMVRTNMPAVSKTGCRLVCYPESRKSPLSQYKTLNHMYYIMANKWAKQHGADEAIILNADGSVSEASSGSILLCSGNTIVRPRSDYVLPGVMESLVCEYLAKQGFSIDSLSVKPNAISTFEDILITNSLIGVVAGVSLDGKDLPRTPDFAESIRSFVLGE